MKLVLCEKPSVGKDIARVLKANKAQNGYMQGNGYIVTWALGHLVTLSDPEKYDKKYATWNLEALPIIFDKPKFSILKQTQKQYNVVKTLLNKKEVKEVIIATDAGREGELVARLILAKTNNKKPIKRLWISSVTDKAIKDGFNNLVDGSKYNSLYMAALARAEADWLLGINATRALTTKYNASLSTGRVQTPTLYMVANQDKKVREFIAREYYTLSIEANNTIFKYVDNKMHVQTFNKKEDLEPILNKVQNKKIKVIEILETKKQKNCPHLYDLTTLQREANSMYGYSAKKTLDIIQSLYEYHKLVTYPRTDSKYLTSDMKSTIKERVVASNVFNIKLDNINYNQKHIFNDQKVSDHHAIIPTEIKANLNQLDNEELRIYKMIVQRFMANLLPKHEYISKKIIAEVDNIRFIANGVDITKPGFMQVYDKLINLNDDEIEDDQEIKNIKLHDQINISASYINTALTKSPKFFTEGSLLAAMEDPSRYIDDINMKKVLRDTGGIGTVATRADIIDKLINSMVIEKSGNNLIITNKGKQLLDVAPNDLKSPLLTAKWEKDLKLIEQRKLNKNKFIDEVKEYTNKVIFDIKNNVYEFKHDNLTNQQCPKCSEKMLYGSSKNGKVLTCSNIECKHKEYIYIPKRNQCPNCMKKLKLIGDTFEKQAFYCEGCGHRKPLSQYIKDQSKNGISKKEVKKQLKKQTSEDVTSSNPFAGLF